MHLVIWAGPVTRANLSSAKLPAGTELVVVNTGLGGSLSSTAFARLGQHYSGSLRELVAARGLGVELDKAETVTLAGFSAAHGLFEQLLRGPDAARVDVLGAFDAYYTAWNAGPKPGYHAFCRRAAEGKALALLTTSSHGGVDYPSSAQAVEVLLADVPLGRTSEPTGFPEPERAMGVGGLVWLDYGARLSHVEHATRLAPRAFDVFTPYLTKRSDSSAELALAAIGLCLAALEAT